jgi:hypothetical protein
MSGHSLDGAAISPPSAEWPLFAADVNDACCGVNFSLFPKYRKPFPGARGNMSGFARAFGSPRHARHAYGA